MTNEALWDWFFHFNPYTEQWNAVRREDIPSYLNGDPLTQILRGDAVHDLQRYIIAEDLQKGKTAKHKR